MMFIEACLISLALYTGSKLREKFDKPSDHEKEHPDLPAVPDSKAVQKRPPDLSPDFESEEFVDQRIRLTLGSTALASAGALFFPPLSLLSAISLLYLVFPVFQIAKDALFRQRRARIEIFDSVCVIVMIASGYFVVSNLACLGYWGARKLRLITEKRSRKSLVHIFGEQPRSVWIIKDGTEIEIPFETLEAGDILVVNAGEQIPADGTIIHGMAAVDQHLLTGEAQPAEKGAGDPVFAATVILSGRLRIKVEKAGKETAAAKIAEILQHTADFTAAIESSGQEAADASTIPAFVLTLGAYPFVGVPGTAALFCSNFLINMRLLSPIGMLNFLRTASRDGLLIKDGRSLQTLNQIDTVVFDKTGTLTLEQPRVRTIHTFDEIGEDALLSLAATAEYRQTHPIALAILEAAAARGLAPAEVDEAGYKIGYGITVRTGGQTIRVGSLRFMETEGISFPQTLGPIADQSHEAGYSLVCVAAGDRLIGAIETAPTLRPEAQEVIRQLKKHSMRFYILSGDHETPTREMARKLGIDRYFAQVLPEQKADIIQRLQQQGRKVCFVGDGINDAIALKKADVSISMLGASTIATDSAQIILMDQTLKKLPWLFDISHGFQENMKDTFLATGYPALVGIGGVFFLHFTVIHMLVLYLVSVASGGAVAMLPALKEKKEQ